MEKVTACRGNEKGRLHVRGLDAAGQKRAATEPETHEEPQECGKSN